ncbi:peptide ABC transporter substrate-binding protein [Ktedonobacter racemifer]|uniref:Extracellular solute-binding protein family 5 n=1 Tax=Ktedonobacter racemifer DSM 44963 TaxID=485913 RepID=D6THA8_KTERA|nr:peptide ABC transporter substrate-binding protein [Ktedonobacter racemifer]EFH90850.1 extracellular solute-binding protein family 5 [Ktedonobacter racemifer DSM 44963]
MHHRMLSQMSLSPGAHNQVASRRGRQGVGTLLLLLCALLLILVACSNGNSSKSPGNGTPSQSVAQVLKFPNVGTEDAASLDPAQGPDENTGQVISMIFSGLVALDANLNVVPDQATWQASDDGKTYTFKIRDDVRFSDGTPVTAQSYIYTWTRALLPEIASPIASTFEDQIIGSDEVASGKTKTLSGLKALDDHTLQVSLKTASPYFLSALTNSLFAPLNQKVIEKYGEKSWPQKALGEGIGAGPFIAQSWDHNVKMVFVPNKYYYGKKTRLQQVEMYFVNDASTAFKAYRAGQYSFIWKVSPQDQITARGISGFRSQSRLQTDLLFFDNTKPPFDRSEVRQAFAYAIDKTKLVNNVLKNAALAAPTIIPPGMPSYQPDYAGIPFDPNKAKSLIQSVYPDITKVPTITFSYPNSQVSSAEAAALQNMWQSALGIQVKLRSVEVTAYNDETAKKQIQFGFTQWGADFPDPYDWLYLNLLSSAANNNGQWKNTEFDATVQTAETKTGDERISLYNKAEQIAITDVGWLPLDHASLAAIIPPTLHGVALNANGLYFGNWSDVYLTQK